MKLVTDKYEFKGRVPLTLNGFSIIDKDDSYNYEELIIPNKEIKICLPIHVNSVEPTHHVYATLTSESGFTKLKIMQLIYETMTDLINGICKGTNPFECSSITSFEFERLTKTIHPGISKTCKCK